MTRQRPVLTARWTELLLLNFRVPARLVAEFAPPGTEADLYAGQAYVSVVGFRFQHARLFGLPIPAHTRFVEINLRSYVRRYVDGGLRRGVVFIKEIAPRRAISATANWLYNENYITRPMRCDIHVASTELCPGDTIEYAWQAKQIPVPSCNRPLRGRPLASPVKTTRWNRFSARVAAPLTQPVTGSLEEFIIENYWGYVRGRDGRTREYQVLHAPWRVALADDIVWDCDLADTYDPPFAEFLATSPASALVADGSAIELFRGRRI